MRIALIADAYPPLRSSAAVQLRDLSEEFARQGHQITMMVASPDQPQPWLLEEWRGVQVLRLKTPRTKDIDYVRRTLGEFLMPHAMWRNLQQSPLAGQQWDGVVWYSPSIFLGPMVQRMKRASRCRSYLIIRDIFPEWAVDMGLMGRGLPYRFFKAIANQQYAVADTIGIQTPGNGVYFQEWQKQPGRSLEVLQNWLTRASDTGCTIDVQQTPLTGCKIFVYAGNMGIAQGMGVLIDLAEKLRHRADIGFLFVGRGSDADKLKRMAAERQLDNVVFFGEIDPDEIPGLYAQCDVGLVALDPRHKTHNIPGKFLSYMHSGLPVLACVNDGNDLVNLIQTEQVGSVSSRPDAAVLAAQAEALLEQLETDAGMSQRCRRLADCLFSSEAAVRQIVASLQA